MRYYLALTNKEILSFATTWIYIKGTMLSELVRERKNTDLTYMWNLKTRKLSTKLKQEIRTVVIRDRGQ